MTDKKDQIRRLLKRLEDHPDAGYARAVAYNLRDLGIIGIRQDPCHCPASNYIRKNMPFSVMGEIALAWERDDEDYDVLFVHAMDLDGVKIRVMAPQAVSRFVSLFDQGEWPELRGNETERDVEEYDEDEEDDDG